MNSEFQPLVIIGPSGVGKSHIVSELVKKSTKFKVIPTWTDRPRRKDEIELEHRFVTTRQFDDLEKLASFLEVVRPFSLPFRYGFKKDQYAYLPDSVPLVLIRSSFVPLAKKHFKKMHIYQIEAPFSQVKSEVLNRNVSNGTRLMQFDLEIIEGRHIADRIYQNPHERNSHQLIAKIMKDIELDFSITL